MELASQRDEMDRLKEMKFSDPSSSSSSFELLFSNVGVEILCRLPSSRAAIRLKLVCKSWCSLISSHYFITFFNHRRHHPSLPPILHSSSACIIFQSQFHPDLPIVCDPEANLCGFRKLDLSFQHDIDVKASFGDLILCAPICLPDTFPKFISVFYVCNLLTKHWTALPPAPQFQLTHREMPRLMAFGLLCVPAPCSLCTQSQSQDNSRYNCVVVQICVHPPLSPAKYRLQLFFSSSQEWKTLVVSLPSPITSRFLLRSSALLVPYKGMLHMLLRTYILVYDPYNSPEKFCRVIDIDMPLPTDMEAEDCCARTLGLSQDQDRLRLTSVCVWGIHLEFPIYYIWELEDYDMGKWSLVHKVDIRRTSMLLSNLDLLRPNLDPKIKDTGFNHKDGAYFHWNNSSGWLVGNGILHSITQHWWPTPVPPTTNPRLLHNSK